MILKFRTGNENINIFRGRYVGREIIEERKRMIKRGLGLLLGLGRTGQFYYLICPAERKDLHYFL